MWGNESRGNWSLGLALAGLLLGGLGGCRKAAPTQGQLEAGAPHSATSAAGTLSDERSSKSGYGLTVSKDKMQFSLEEKRVLLRLARTSVESYLKLGRVPPVPEELSQKYPGLREPGACFVTLRKYGDLRGCIGSLEPRRSLLEDVRSNAISAAVHDSRFAPVSEQELGQLELEISVLDAPRDLEGVTREQLPAYLAEHHPGVVIEYHGRRSTFLPSVWEELTEPVDFLDKLCRKQGSPPECWRENAARISTYGSVHFAEKEVFAASN